MGWHTLKTDGCVRLKRRHGGGGGGGLLRGSSGEWVVGFSINLGVCSIEEAELWAIVHGLRVAWRIGIRALIEETD